MDCRVRAKMFWAGGFGFDDWLRGGRGGEEEEEEEEEEGRFDGQEWRVACFDHGVHSSMGFWTDFRIQLACFCGSVQGFEAAS